ncbi:hypothetical protein [Lacticaseibacillus saniviri]|uniref:Uncharacterized protein n=2 Tax=Lacticaseibacillus saniviri TaxID=931533 RepID=A0A0R2MY72_9LACO|nr:hypothetical protein [Lacticaseibacillus saniviri]KRO17378.1 hypothetical protein IV56_GL000343 [Lacticaseibacillus saniviri JCM 17471 = DSM 24301]
MHRWLKNNYTIRHSDSRKVDVGMPFIPEPMRIKRVVSAEEFAIRNQSDTGAPGDIGEDTAEQINAMREYYGVKETYTDDATKQEESVIMLAQGGMTQADIARRVHLRADRVIRILARAGIDATPYRYRDTFGTYYHDIRDVAIALHVSKSRVTMNSIPGVRLERGEWTAAQIAKIKGAKMY